MEFLFVIWEGGEGAEPASPDSMREQMGPYVETKEVIGGYFVVEADSLDEAVDLARRCPGAAYGAVEVREILPMG